MKHKLNRNAAYAMEEMAAAAEHWMDFSRFGVARHYFLRHGATHLAHEPGRLWETISSAGYLTTQLEELADITASIESLRIGIHVYAGKNGCAPEDDARLVWFVLRVSSLWSDVGVRLEDAICRFSKGDLDGMARLGGIKGAMRGLPWNDDEYLMFSYLMLWFAMQSGCAERAVSVEEEISEYFERRLAGKRVAINVHPAFVAALICMLSPSKDESRLAALLGPLADARGFEEVFALLAEAARSCRATLSGRLVRSFYTLCGNAEERLQSKEKEAREVIRFLISISAVDEAYKIAEKMPPKCRSQALVEIARKEQFRFDSAAYAELRKLFEDVGNACEMGFYPDEVLRVRCELLAAGRAYDRLSLELDELAELSRPPMSYFGALLDCARLFASSGDYGRCEDLLTRFLFHLDSPALLQDFLPSWLQKDERPFGLLLSASQIARSAGLKAVLDGIAACLHDRLKNMSDDAHGSLRAAEVLISIGEPCEAAELLGRGNDKEGQSMGTNQSMAYTDDLLKVAALLWAAGAPDSGKAALARAARRAAKLWGGPLSGVWSSTHVMACANNLKVKDQEVEAALGMLRSVFHGANTSFSTKDEDEVLKELLSRGCYELVKKLSEHWGVTREGQGRMLVNQLCSSGVCEATIKGIEDAYGSKEVTELVKQSLKSLCFNTTRSGIMMGCIFDLSQYLLVNGQSEQLEAISQDPAFTDPCKRAMVGIAMCSSMQSSGLQRLLECLSDSSAFPVNSLELEYGVVAAVKVLADSDEVNDPTVLIEKLQDLADQHSALASLAECFIARQDEKGLSMVVARLRALAQSEDLAPGRRTSYTWLRVFSSLFSGGRKALAESFFALIDDEEYNREALELLSSEGGAAVDRGAGIDRARSAVVSASLSTDTMLVRQEVLSLCVSLLSFGKFEAYNQIVTTCSQTLKLKSFSK